MSLLASLAVLVSPGPVVRPLAVWGPDDWNATMTVWYRAAVRAAPGEWAVAIADQNGHMLWSLNPTQPMIPASTVKVFTTGFARSVVGGEARQRTRVIGVGQIGPDGTWLGNWSLELNGDPTLERPERGGPSLQDLAFQLSGQGIRRFTGPMTVQSAVGIAEATWPSAWPTRHRGRLFAPLIGALTLNENMVSFTISPGVKVGDLPILSGASPSGLRSMISITARTIAGRSQRLQFRALGSGRYSVTGTIGVRARPRGHVGVSSDPRSVLEASWAEALSQAGIVWDQKVADAITVSTDRQVLAEVTSASFDSVASEVNRRSHNLGAELLLRWAAGSDHPADRLTEHVRLITGEGARVYLVDGSGLSSEDRATAWSFVAYMARFGESAAGRNFHLLFPANGTGTLKQLTLGLPGNGVVRAKTGTLGNAATLVGYLGRADGVLLISLLYNGGSVYAARQQQWKLFRLLGADGVMIDEDTTVGTGIGSH